VRIVGPSGRFAARRSPIRKRGYIPLHAGAQVLLKDYLDEPRHAADTEGAIFRPVSNNRTGHLDNSITPESVYKLVRRYALALGLKIGAHALRATAAANALDHDADINKVREWLGHANIATTRIYDWRRMKVEDSPTFKVSY
jgi:integrase/recombinase XerD